MDHSHHQQHDVAERAGHLEAASGAAPAGADTQHAAGGHGEGHAEHAGGHDKHAGHSVA
jgi:hypothetical protein